MWARLGPPLGPRAVDVVTLGENSLDFVAVLASDEPSGGKHQLNQFDLRPGGQAATAAAACARLGLRARYVGALGDDEWGARTRAALRDAGVDLVVVEHAGHPSRIAVVVVNTNGDRTILEHRDSALAIDPIPEGAIEGGRLLLVDATDGRAAAEAVRRARRAGIPTLVDVDRIAGDVEGLLEQIDIIIVPAPFVLAFTGAGAVGQGLADLTGQFPGASAVIATAGEEGSIARVRGQEIHTPAFKVAVLDTTGAGDAFRGGFAAAWVRFGPETAISDLLVYANATAALNCLQVGAQTGLPSHESVLRLVTERSPGRSK